MWDVYVQALLTEFTSIKLPDSLTTAGWVFIAIGIAFHLVNMYSERSQKKPFGNSLPNGKPTCKNKAAELNAQELDQLLSFQKLSIMNAPICFSETSFPPSRDFIIPELFIQPKVKPSKNDRRIQQLKDWIGAAPQESITLLTGPAGIGKSFSISWLYYIFLENYRCNMKDRKLPIYISPHMIVNFNLEIQSIISEVIAYHGFIDKSIDEDVPMIILIDGLDEVGQDASLKLLRSIIKYCKPNNHIFLACRSEFYLSYLQRDPIINSLITEILILQAWDSKNEGTEFAVSYLKKVNAENKISRFIELRDKHEGVRKLIENPLHATLLLLIITEPGIEYTNRINSRYELYGVFFSSWLNRETERFEYPLPKETIAEIHLNLAFHLYKNRGSTINLEEYLTSLRPKGCKLTKIQIETLLKDYRLIGLLRVFSDEFEKFAVHRYTHESIGDYLVAKYITSSMQSRKDTIRKVIFNQYNNEVNWFTKEYFEQLNKDESAAMCDYMSRQYSIYQEEIEKSGFANEMDVRIDQIKIKEQMLYYIGRLNLGYPARILNKVFLEDKDLIIQRAAAISAILQGDFETEKSYIQTLTPDSEADLINRSMDLAYNGDVNEEPHYYKDLHFVDWTLTKSAILLRLDSIKKRDILLRWWDLRSLKLFLVNRGGSGFNSKDLAIVKSCKLITHKKRQVELQKEKEEILLLMAEMA